VFILEAPYVSDALAEAAATLGLPVLDTPAARAALASRGVTLLGDAEFAEAYRSTPGARLYANSENAIGWVAEHLADTGLPAAIEAFKDKYAFRRMLEDLHPEVGFAGCTLAELREFDPTSIAAPFVVKPAVGFFSMGVHVVEDPAQWAEVVARIQHEAGALARIYPDAVLGLDRFVIEQVIEGDEYAVDAYFDSDGEPVIVNVLGHLFASASDVSDRVYITDTELVGRWREPFAEYLREVGRRADLRDFPVHAELRVDSVGRIAPIEVNPMRFAGWCVTDIARHAYGIDPYRAYLLDEAPDWAAISSECAGTVTAAVIADLPSTLDRSTIASVDYEAFSTNFSDLRELRRVDYVTYPVFAFAFVQVPAGELGELQAMLGADMTRYLQLG